MTRHPTPLEIRIAISNAIFDHQDKVFKDHKDGRLTREQYQAALFPIEALNIIREAVSSACEKKDAENAA